MTTNFKKSLFALFNSNFVNYSIVVRVFEENMVCPEFLKNSEFVRFDISDKATGFVEILDDGVSIKMRFNLVEEICFFPWYSVIMIESESCAYTDKVIQPQKSLLTSQEKVENKVIENNDDDNWIEKETKYSHLKLLERKN